MKALTFWAGYQTGNGMRVTGGVVMLIAAGAVFAVFFGNIVIAAAGGTAFLSDVGEMLTLFAACVCFVIAVLWRERTAFKNRQMIRDEPGTGGDLA